MKIKRAIKAEKRRNGWWLRENAGVATLLWIFGEGGERNITSKGATWRNLNESKVPTSLLLKLVSQRERNRVFSSMLLDRVSDAFVVDTETRIYTRWIP